MIKNFAKDTIKYLPSQIVPAIVGLISVPIITRLFSAADYGNYTLVLSTITILTTLTGWVSMSFFRFYPAYEKDKKLDVLYGTTLKWLFISIFGVAILFLVVILFTKNYFSQTLYNLMLIGLGVFICSGLFESLLGILRIKRLAGWYSGFISWKSIGTYVIGIFLILGLNFGIEGLLLGSIISIILILPLLWKKALGGFSRFRGKFSSLLSQEMVLYSFPLVVGNLANWILNLSDRYVLNFFCGAQDVGIYSASYSIGENSILFIVSLFMLASGPFSIHIWEKEGEEKSQDFITKVTRYFLIICLPITVGIGILAKPIMNIFVDQSYIGGYRILPIIALSMFFLGLSQRFSVGLSFHKKTSYNMWALLVGAGINLGLNVIFVPKYGYLGAAINTLVGYITMLTFIIYFSRKFFKWKFPFKTLLKCIFASLVMGGVVYFLVNNLHFNPFLNLFLEVLVGCLIYFICLFLSKEILPEEENVIKQVLKKYYFQAKEKKEVAWFKFFNRKFTKFISQTFINNFKKENPRFFINIEDKKAIINIFKSKFSNRFKNILKEANDIYQHNFDSLGSGKVNLGEKINWHCDFKSGFIWDSKTFYLDIKYGDMEGVDVKVPWELSRFQHLTILGEAYWLTGNEKYTKEFISEVTDWIENNPPQYGVNWKCTMDVAIRACNWILGFYFFKDSREINDEFFKKFLKSLLIHGKHIERNLEKGKNGLTSNHYLSDIVGLVYLGIFFKDINIGRKWLDFGIKELKNEMQKQVYPDGCDFEASTCYHRLVLELFFFATLLVTINNKEFDGENYREISEKIFGKKYTRQLYKMFNAVLYLLKPNGKMPQIGDNDNGRLHIFTKREILDMRYLLVFGAIFFQESKFKVGEFNFSEDAIWIFGVEGYNIWQGLKENSLSNVQSKSFPNAGWYVMRNYQDYCIISCGPNGQNGNGGHCHNDKLSFELMIDRKDIIVDPGTYVYTPYPEWRNKFRSTAFHNTVVIDSEEQNRFINNNLFSLMNNVRCECLDFSEDDQKILFKGVYQDGKKHYREIKFYKDEQKIEIIDKIEGEKIHTLKWNFYFASDLKIKFLTNNIILIGKKKFYLDNKIKWQIMPTCVSLGYGNKVMSYKVEAYYQGEINQVFTQILKI